MRLRRLTHPANRPTHRAAPRPRVRVPRLEAEPLTPEQEIAMAEFDADVERNRQAIACPAWCRTDHAHFAEGELMEGVRECSTESPTLPGLAGGSYSAEAVRFTDLQIGAIRQPEIRLNGPDAGTLTPANARRLAAQLLNAADIADVPPADTTTDHHGGDYR
ncbi:hypothetical protein ACIBF5_15880 [Micromonospora sp. NPDC050417]|uniref:hypothetical protein n=1 Tax=Micromonospora sp. NPDC050417 TaxID=3364280 RepID=UPI0037BAC18C